MDFYTGRVLRVDLGRLQAVAEPLRQDWAGLYLGGKGLLFRYLFDELKPGIDPLSAENPLLLATGPFAGTTAAACSRLVVGCKSPASGTILDSYVGGSFAPELKFAGYDMVILTGRAPEPVLIRIEDEQVSFLPAQPRYWGAETGQLEKMVREEMDPAAKVLSIGPAGENLVPFACISTDQYHKAGRGGAGAVLGAKNVKAIVVRGTGSVTVGDARRFQRDMLRLVNERVLTEDNWWAVEEGTAAIVDAVDAGGALPTRNFRTGSFHGVEAIDSQALLSRKTGVRACTQCPVACRQVHRFKDQVCEGPEYETIGLCGSNCGISDLDALAAFNRECDDLGLDTISCGAVVGLAMESCEAGAADFGLRFGEAAGYLAAPRMIATRDGFGAELALGAKALASLHGRPELAFHVKNLEMPAYDPRGTFGMGLAYATSDRGACHMRGFPANDELLAGTRPPDTLQGKAQYVIDLQDFNALTWSCSWCANIALDLDLVAAHVRHLWKREPEPGELTALGARVWNLGRLLNVREGFGRRQDCLPERILTTAHPTGAAAGRIIGSQTFQEALDEYYLLRGWDADGVPREETLSRLEVDVRV
jgi:aldehyde:ferredoxin oxidoreductase